MFILGRIVLAGLVIMIGVGCGQVDVNNTQGAVSGISIFSLATHKQSGTCSNLPIKHRFLSFQPILLSLEGSNVFIGILELALDEDTKTYQAHYQEVPGSENTDTTVFTTNLSGSYSVSKVNKLEILTLENLGTVVPTALGTRIIFNLKLGRAIHRQLLETSSPGLVREATSRIFDDACLFQSAVAW